MELFTTENFTKSLYEIYFGAVRDEATKNLHLESSFSRWLDLDSHNHNHDMQLAFQVLSLALTDFNFANALLSQTDFINIRETQEYHHKHALDVDSLSLSSMIESNALFSSTLEGINSDLGWLNERVLLEIIEVVFAIAVISCESEAEVLDRLTVTFPIIVFSAYHQAKKLRLKIKGDLTELRQTVLTYLMDAIADKADCKTIDFRQKDEIIILSKLSKSYMQINLSPKVNFELLYTERKSYKDQCLNENTTLMDMNIPKFIFQDGNKTAIFKCAELDSNLSIENNLIENAMRYTLSNDPCECSHDCCGCISTSVSADILNDGFIAMRYSQTANY